MILFLYYIRIKRRCQAISVRYHLLSEKIKKQQSLLRYHTAGGTAHYTALCFYGYYHSGNSPEKRLS